MGAFKERAWFVWMPLCLSGFSWFGTPWTQTVWGHPIGKMVREYEEYSFTVQKQERPLRRRALTQAMNHLAQTGDTAGRRVAMNDPFGSHSIDDRDGMSKGGFGSPLISAGNGITNFPDAASHQRFVVDIAGSSDTVLTSALESGFVVGQGLILLS